MPFSTPVFKEETIDFIKSKFRPTDTVLDIGAGSGTYSDRLKDYFHRMDAVEIFTPYIEEYHLKDKYTNVFNEDILTFDFDYYDLIILGDVLEHISEEDGVALIARLYPKCREMIIAVPKGPQGIFYDNQAEIHLQENLTFESFMRTYTGFRPFALRDDFGVYIKDVPENRKYLITYDILWGGERINAASDRDTGEGYLMRPQPPEGPLANTTIVTGFWNIGRVGRDIDHYILHLKNLLNIDAKLFLYLPLELEHYVWENPKRTKKNTYVRVWELSDVKDLMAPFWDKIQSIRTSEAWQNLTGEGGWLKGSPQAVNEWYNPIVMAKMPMLHNAVCWNPFDTENFVWIDSGITHTVYDKMLIENKALEKMVPHLSPFLFLSYPYETTQEIHGFPKDKIDSYATTPVHYVCRGGLFGGTKAAIREANTMYYSLLMDTLSAGYMGTEESIFTIMSYRRPEIFRRYELDENGLIIKYIQALLDDTAELVPVAETAKKFGNVYMNTEPKKTDLYILTFNFPEQLTEIFKSLEKADWLSKANEVIVIDNSNNPDSIVANRIIAMKHGATYHPSGKNGGICGGRMIAAQMFDASDADYYVFFEDDMLFYFPEDNTPFCRNGFRTIIPGLFEKLEKIMQKEDFDFLKLSFTEVYMDNNIQVSWYNVPQVVRSAMWPDYDKLPVHGLDPNCPRTSFQTIDNVDGLCYITGDIYYANWPTIMNKAGNYKVFLETTWAHPYEQTWMSYVFQEMLKDKIHGAVLLASPIHHHRTSHYEREDRREN